MFHSIIFSAVRPQQSNLPVERVAGPHRIATYLRSQGWDVEVIDYLNFWSFEEIKELLKSRINSNTKFVGIGLFNSNWQETYSRVFKWIKKNYPSVLTIVGGNSSIYDELSYHDYAITGFAENALTALFSNNSKISKSTKIINGNIDHPSFPMQDLSIRYEKRDLIKETEWTVLELSRGCKFKCSFCNFPILGVKGDYTASAKIFEKNLKYNFDEFGIKNYYIADETFNDRTEKIIKFADVVEQLPFLPYFSGYIRADLLVSRQADREHLLRMNFLGQYYGIETLNKDSGKSIGKGMDPEKLWNGLLDSKSYFQKHSNYYRGLVSLIIGLPHETVDTWKNTWKKVKQDWAGQAVSLYPLFIPKENSLALPSTLTTSFKKYNYVDIETEDNKHMFYPIFERYVAHPEQLMFWKNDDMNFLFAEMLLQQAYMDFNLFRTNPYNLSFYQDRKFDEIFSVGINDTNFYNYIKKIEEYKHYKLSNS